MYVTDALRMICENTARYAGGGYPKARWADIIRPPKEETRTAEEIVNYMKSRIKSSKLRHNEYYCMQDIYDELYQKSKAGGKFRNLMRIITCENNIKLAYRNIKNNTGSQTYGTHFMNIKDIEQINVDEFVEIIQRKFKNYQPKAVKRVEIPKERSDKTGPLGIPTMYDRLIQQCILQI